MFKRVIVLTIGVCPAGAIRLDGALGDDRSPTMGETHPADVVEARGVMMTGVGRTMDEIPRMLADGGTFSLNEAREHADLISTMPLAFTLLFPLDINTWVKNPCAGRFGAPDRWRSRRCGDFLARAQQASPRPSTRASL